MTLKLPFKKQIKANERMREELSIRQIARITGVPTEIVRKYWGERTEVGNGKSVHSGAGFYSIRRNSKNEHKYNTEEPPPCVLGSDEDEKDIIENIDAYFWVDREYGNQSLSLRIRCEIIKDKWLLSNGHVDYVEWHFFTSMKSSTIGGSQPLYNALKAAGFKIVFH